MQANMGITGEFRCVVKRADGSTKVDTGYQKNLILDQGLDFFGGNNDYDMMAYCVIGSGSSQPSYTQNKLDATVAGVSGTEASYKTDYNASLDGNLYKTNKVYKYSFTGLNNVNISELGLASTYSNTSTYYLCTRALIKDSQGNPTTITILSGEILEIYYKLWKVTNITDVSGVMAVKDGLGGSVNYNYTVRAAYVGSNINRSFTGEAFANPTKPAFYTGGLGQITGEPSDKIDNSLNPAVASTAYYTKGSYKRIYLVNAATDSSNGLIRTIVVGTKFGYWQIQVGDATNDQPLKKTSTQTFMLRVEFSWGRYEGAL